MKRSFLIVMFLGLALTLSGCASDRAYSSPENSFSGGGGGGCCPGH